jgi:hypothetical protein
MKFIKVQVPFEISYQTSLFVSELLEIQYMFCCCKQYFFLYG